MKRERDGGKMIFFKKCFKTLKPADELAQNVSKKIPFGRIYSSIFSAKVQNLTVFSNYLHDSNSIFGLGELIQNYFRRAQ